ncbi:hypothetical protein G6678_08945 [Polynucleobacter paneuropaeus]|jgi:hypothetical protein|uniref:hypothetical protein n=1 Tax=Polynucleobacter nymphae TaxID=2081043 RepID=UPI001BFDC041|nr:hypothetical protein [Polynucleobacter nymphae]MBT8520342.1 hypothetical protein [Polynucleobacter paneuropaeus]MBT8540778.1 hypothetical protein [Polynucleobacter paneuropaeus]MBT8606409.1 hypothetical protein [Polynucleobacter paneuropaeus]MBU3608156.1 hypothetical protein [Polynucleobacter nymphae]QWD12544.1 hypothetical protein G6704_08895 [Polynucleobacter paneuropaeus]
MYWKIRFRVNKSADSPISTIRIDSDTLRDACLDVLSIYRNATILSYQEDGGEVKAFDLSDIGAKTYPIDPLIFSAAKE